MEKHGEVTLAIDIMFINRIPFIMMASGNIHFDTAELIKDMKNNTLVTSIEQAIQAYQARGFRIKAILADGQFKHIQQIIKQKVSHSTYVPPMNMYQKLKGTSEL